MGEWERRKGSLSRISLHNNEGKISSIRYPNGSYYGYGYDTMARLYTMTNLNTSAQIITETNYDPANRVLSISGNLTESRTYNAMGQLTQLTSAAGTHGPSLNVTYNYSSTQNNGKITSQTDNISGEQVVYAYDALNRLASAGATSDTWGQSYTYDGFGNLLDQTVTEGTAPSLSVVYNAANNLQTTDCADANGNITGSEVDGHCTSQLYSYDAKNRIASAGGIYYVYAPGNKRVWRGQEGNGGVNEVAFWSITGQKLATCNLTQGQPVEQNGTWMATLACTGGVTNTYFGGKLLSNGTGNVVQDRLGSIGKFYPWGQEKPSATTNGTEKFTGYFRDSETGLDYAQNRYHQSGMGRFLSTDSGAPTPANPGNWNRYAYVIGDPITYNDPTGREECDPNDNDDCDGDSDDNGDDGGGGGGSSGSSNGTAPLVNSDGSLVDVTSVEVTDALDQVALAPNPTAIQTAVSLIVALMNQIGEAATVLLLSPTTLGANDTVINGIVMDPKWVEDHCDKVGDPVVVPSTNPNYPGGQSIEQMYLCPDGELYTIHILQKKSGKQGEKHVRPGPPKYGGPKPIKKYLP